MKNFQSIRSTRKKVLWLFLIVLAIAIGRYSYYQIVFASENKIEAKEEESGSQSPAYLHRWGWVTQTWAEDKWNLREVRQTLDDLFETKLSPQRLNELSNTYHIEYKEDPKNVTKAFKWVYFYYKVIVLHPNFDINQLSVAKGVSEKTEPLTYGGLFQATVAMERDEAPTYEESRLRFLIEARGRPVKELITIGDRLVEYDPKDYETKYYLVGVLDPSRSEEEFQKALSYAKELVSMQPKRHSVYSALGGTYFEKWLRTHNSEDASEAIKAYNTYLQLAPENDSFRSQAKSLIAFMNK